MNLQFLKCSDKVTPVEGITKNKKSPSTGVKRLAQFYLLNDNIINYFARRFSD